MNGPSLADGNLPLLPLYFRNDSSRESARSIILALRPEWETAPGKIEFVEVTDGITNNLLKVVKRTPGLSDPEIDEEAVLLRAYGNKTDVIIDRDREIISHLLLAQKGLAPPLLARFENGLLYKFIQGWVTTSKDLQQPKIYRAVARHLAQWHAVLPVPAAKDSGSAIPLTNGLSQGGSKSNGINGSDKPANGFINGITNGVNGSVKKSLPSLWTVMQKWIIALPSNSESEASRNERLQTELDSIVKKFAHRPGLGEDNLVYAHCDLLSANVIVHPKPQSSQPNGTKEAEEETVSFIDYEYATPSPAAFDIANHFAEWGGFDCDYGALPTRSQRQEFLRYYLESYVSHSRSDHGTTPEELFAEVDVFRGLPGFYWGVWALIQASISQIDFDYTNYADLRLGEYWAWKDEVSGEREATGREKPLRERRWAEE